MRALPVCGAASGTRPLGALRSVLEWRGLADDEFEVERRCARAARIGMLLERSVLGSRAV